MTEDDIEALFYKGDYPMWKEKLDRGTPAEGPLLEPTEAPPILPAGGKVCRTVSTVHKGSGRTLLTVDERGRATVLGDYGLCDDRTLAELATAILDHLSEPGKALHGDGLSVRTVTYELERWLAIPY